MTERSYVRETETPTTVQRDTYQETVSPSTQASIPVDASREVVQERVASPAGERVVRQERVSQPSETMRRASGVTRIKQVVYFIFGAINVLLVLRFVFLLLGASEASSFIQFIYSLSQPFVAPFLGIFGEPSLGNSVVEWASLVAIAIYSLVSYGIARVVELIYAPARPTVS
jgi:hypothetical protein